jgi:16S rRNA processing protein RimM
MAPNDKNKLLVGRIVGAQGLRGEVRVQTFTQNPKDFAQLAISSEQLAIKFVRVLPSSSIVIMKVDGFDDRNAAEDLRGMELFISRDDLPALPAGEFYQIDLIGSYLRGNGRDGIVIAVHNFGAGDILELDNGDMVSFAGAKVDLENKSITIQGLGALNQT